VECQIGNPVFVVELAIVSALPVLDRKTSHPVGAGLHELYFTNGAVVNL